MFSPVARGRNSALGVMFCLALLGLFGCEQRSTSTPEQNSNLVQDTGSEASGSRPAVSIADGSGAVADGYTVNGRKVAEGYGMTYSETALDEVIPALPMFGFANGQPFNAGTIVFRQDENGDWHLEVSDYAFDPLKGTAAGRLEKPDLQTVYISLPNEPAPGKPLGQTMQYGGGYFQIKPSPEAAVTTSWNTSLSYKLEVDSWEKKQSVPGSCGKPAIGAAAGKLFVSFKGSEEEGRIRNSWISGQFTLAAILYCAQ